MKNWYKIIGVMLWMVLLNCFPFSANSQEVNVFESDTLYFEPEVDSIFMKGFRQLDSISIVHPVVIRPFKPNPNRAVLYSAIFPGLGQIYNRKYWKAPIVYGGFVGFTYVITWNNKNLQDCGEAYKDLSYDLEHYKIDEPEKWHQSWQNFVAAGRNPAERFDDNFKSQLKRWRDLYRRNRDLSIIMAVGFYLICMADAYVDAQLFDFDISPDLSFRVEPIFSPGTNYSSRLYGFNCSIKF